MDSSPQSAGGQGDEADGAVPVQISPSLKKLWFGFLSGLIFWLVLTYGHTFMLLASKQLFIYKQNGSVFINDFLVFYNSGTLAWDSLREGINFYDPAVQKAGMDHLMGEPREQIFYSQNPPHVFALLMPIALAPIEWSWIIWVLVATAGILFSTESLLRQTTTLHGKFTRVFAFVSVFSAFPTWLCIKLGQVSLLAFPAYVWFWISLKQKKWFRAGLLGGFCLIKLQYAPIIFLTGAILGGIRFIAGYSIVALLLFTIPGLLFGWQTWLRYPEALRYSVESTQVTGVNPDGQQNLRGQLYVLFNGEEPAMRMAITAMWIITAMIVAFMWWRAKNRGALVAGSEAVTGTGPSGLTDTGSDAVARTVPSGLIDAGSDSIDGTGPSGVAGSSDASDAASDSLELMVDSSGDSSSVSADPAMKSESKSNDSSGIVQRRFMIFASLSVLAQLIASPHTHSQDYIFVSLTCLWLMDGLIGYFPLMDPPPLGEGKKANHTILIFMRGLLIGFSILSWVGFMYTKMLPVFFQPLLLWAVTVLLLAVAALATAKRKLPD